MIAAVRLHPLAGSLQDRMLPRSFLLRPEDVFADLEREPVAAASIAQVHRARFEGEARSSCRCSVGCQKKFVETDLTVSEQIVKSGHSASLAPNTLCAVDQPD